MPNATDNSGEKDLIYIVDDEEVLLHLAEVALRSEGYILKKFQNPQDAFEAFIQEPRKPLLLLTDYSMGSMSGIELSAMCKGECPTLKVLMVSGTAGPEIIVDSPVKVDDFLAKPYDMRTLANAVRDLVNKTKAQSGAA